MVQKIINAIEHKTNTSTWMISKSFDDFEFSNSFFEMFNLKDKNLSLEDISSIIFRDKDDFLKLLANTIKNKTTFKHKFTYINNEIKEYFFISCDIYYKGKEVEYLYGIVKNTTKEYLHMISTQNYISMIDKYVITSKTDLKGNITYVSEAFCKISGYSEDELLGENHRLIKHPDMKYEAFQDIWLTITSGNTWQGEVKNKKKNGGYYWVIATISPLVNEINEIIGYQSIRQDITDKKYIQQTAITDELTTLNNRRHFNNIFPEEINKAKRIQSNLIFVMLDIDNFKKYNDTYGHQMGDDALVKVSFSLKNSFKRSNDIVFRLGGEEFGVLFSTKNETDIFEIVNQARQNIQNLNIQHKQNPFEVVTVSLGIKKVILDSKNDITNIINTTYKQADENLYEAKETGKNKVIYK